jgi:Ca2+-binding EF-hand superfamily protein
VQRQLTETVAELLRVYLKGKHPLKSDEDINNMMKKKVNGNINEDEWTDIVKYMYNTDDSVTILMRIKDILKQRQAPRRRQMARSRRELAREAEDVPDPTLSYREFLRILLDFQLEGHERFLSRFVRIFKQHDTDRNGIVNEHEFRQILRSVDPTKSEKEVAALLDLIDPYNNQLITFSECVTFLSSELVNMLKEEGTA